MIRNSETWAEVRGTWATVAAACGLALTVLLPTSPSVAAPVSGVYAASVPGSDASPAGLKAAYSEALRRVLVKATGREIAAQDAALFARLGDPAALIQQYRRDNSGGIWVQFDPAAIRRGLQAAGYAVWSEDRPLTLVWLAVDNGNGGRELVLDDDLPASSGDSVTADLRRDLLLAADSYAVPLRLPSRTDQDAVSAADVWADATDRLSAASRRYKSDAILIGKVQTGGQDVRWTLLAGNQRAEWRGSLAEGPKGLAERLAGRLVAAGAAEQGLQMKVSGLRTADDYGLVLGYLQTLDLVARCAVVRASEDSVTFSLQVRGDRERLEQALAVRHLLEPGPPAEGGDAELAYHLETGR